MNILPSSNLKILQNVRLFNDKNDTFYPTSKTDQYNAFATHVKYNVPAMSYIRVNERIRIKVPYNAELLYDCNYIMFQNANFGTKWFYAYITAIHYIADGVSAIEYKIDVIQTWLFETTLGMSYVEREHSVTDKIGGNIVAEPALDTGPIVCERVQGTSFFDSYSAVIATAYDTDDNPGGYIGGLFTGLKYLAGSVDTPSDVQELLDYIKTATEANKVDSIVSIFMMPTAFVTLGESSLPTVETVTVGKNNRFFDYTPRNNKLLTAPYNFLEVDCGNDVASYRYEYFTGENCQFSLTCGMGCNPEIILTPASYDGSSDTVGEFFNYKERLVMTGFPQCAFAIDAFRAWLAQKASGEAINMIGLISGGAMNALSGNVGGALNSYIGLAQSVNNIMIETNQGGRSHGVQGSDTMVATRAKNFYFRQMHITKEYAQIIDGYFDMFGYATNQLKVPNRGSRPHWNYVKTREANVYGNVPSDDLDEIKQRYDNGIRFWKKLDNIGNYLLDNSPTGSD